MTKFFEQKTVFATLVWRRWCGRNSGYSSRSVSKQDGSRPTIGIPFSAYARELIDIPRRVVLRLAQHPFGNHRPAAASLIRPSAHDSPKRSSRARRGDGDVGRVEVIEGVMKHNHFAFRPVAFRLVFFETNLRKLHRRIAAMACADRSRRSFSISQRFSPEPRSSWKAAQTANRYD